MDIEYDDEEEVGSWNCSGDYVEILGQRYCGTSLPDPIISCNDLKVTFQSDNNAVFNKAEERWSRGFRAVWTEIPDDGECGLHTLSHLYCVWCRQASRVPVFRGQ